MSIVRIDALDWLADQGYAFGSYLAGTARQASLLSYGDLPIWAWSIAGVVLWKILFSVLRSPFKRRRKPSRRSVRAQKQVVRQRHKGWKKEATQVLKKLKSMDSDQEVGGVIQGMSPYAFEYLITEGLKGKGVEVRKVQRASGDGGIDGMCHVEGRWHLVQAKRYRAPVPSQTIEEFLEVCRKRKMPGVFVASSGFTQPAHLLAKRSKRLILMDGPGLVKAIR